MDKATMTVREMQNYMSIGRAKAYELVYQKGFPSFRIGRKILISREGLTKWMKEQEVKKSAD